MSSDNPSFWCVNQSPETATSVDYDTVEHLLPPVVDKAGTVKTHGSNSLKGISFGRKKEGHAVMSTYAIGLNPTREQREALDLQCRASMHAYNYCLWLCKRKLVREPNQVQLNKIVSMKSAKDIPWWMRTNGAEYEGELVCDGDDDWYFDRAVSTHVKHCAVQRFCQTFQDLENEPT